jgi:hypothetical protein
MYKYIYIYMRKTVYRKKGKKGKWKNGTLKSGGGLLMQRLIQTIGDSKTGNKFPSDISNKIDRNIFHQQLIDVANKKQKQRKEEYNEYLENLKHNDEIRKLKAHRQRQSQINAGYNPGDVTAPLAVTRQKRENRVYQPWYETMGGKKYKTKRKQIKKIKGRRSRRNIKAGMEQPPLLRRQQVGPLVATRRRPRRQQKENRPPRQQRRLSRRLSHSPQRPLRELR